MIASEAGSDSRTRKKILRATLDWAAETGLLRLSMNGVAKRARIARATLYLHFPGKQALIDAAIDHEITELMSALRGVLDLYDDFDDRVVHGFAHGWRLITGNPVLQSVLRLNPEALVPHIVGATDTLERGAEFIALILRPGDLPEHIDQQMAVDFATRLMIGLVLSPPASLGPDSPGGPEQWARTFLLPVLRG